MDPDRDASNTDEYFMTAVQIFEYCGGQSSGTLRVDALMDKFAPFVKTNNSEFALLKSLLDPDQSNPEVNVGRLARALNQYSDRQKASHDIEESFNIKSGPLPQDSDSGISTDGFQVLEELQSELREKSHLALQLRSQLEFSDRQHEEAVGTLTAERDSLRAHLNLLREENMSLSHVKRDYEEACDRLSATESALEDALKELEQHRKRSRTMDDRIQVLEIEKLDLQELLAKSRSECHRINDMYASRQSALLEENETLRAEHADLSARMQDHGGLVQRLIREKMHLEMELKDVLNKSNQSQRPDHSIDVSYTEDQMLSALDSITADSRFVQEQLLLDEEAFLKALNEGDQGRSTNMSLFDEIRQSMTNSTHPEFNVEEQNTSDDTPRATSTSTVAIGTQTDLDINLEYEQSPTARMETKNQIQFVDIAIQTMENKEMSHVQELIRCYDLAAPKQIHKSIPVQTEHYIRVAEDTVESENIAVQTNIEDQTENNNNASSNHYCFKCVECEKRNQYTCKLKNDLMKSQSALADLHEVLNKYELNLDLLEKMDDENNKKNTHLETVVKSLQTKLAFLEVASDSQRDIIENVSRFCEDIEYNNVECQTESDHSSVGTQVEVPCTECVSQRGTPRGLRRFFWDALKSLFQLFAVICFVCAVSALYSASSGTHRSRCREVPWRWLDAGELLDLLLRIDYGADVPM